MTESTPRDSWSGPEGTSLPHHPMGLLNEHPLPTGAADVESLWERNEQLQHEYDEPPHPDELHEKYLNTLAKTDHWEAFTVTLYGFGMQIYFWSRGGGYGFWINTLDEEDEMLKDLFHQL